MIGDIIGEDNARRIFVCSMLSSAVMEKRSQAGAAAGAAAKAAAKSSLGSVLNPILNKIWGGAALIPAGAATVGKSIVPTLLWTSAMGAGLGYLGATAYDTIKERLSREDPETKFNSEAESMYKIKSRELADSEWITNVRKKRDELVKGRGKLSAEDYERKFNDLVDTLNERLG